MALQVAPLIVHQQSAAAVHQPGSPLIASTQVGGVVAWLQTSPPHVLPLAMQSVSFVHFAPVPAVEPRSPVALGTLPPPIKLLRRPILLASLSANHTGRKRENEKRARRRRNAHQARSSGMPLLTSPSF